MPISAMDAQASQSSVPIGPVLNLSPFDPTQATPTPTPAGTVFLDTFTNGALSYTTSTSNKYMGDGFKNTTLAGTTTYVSIRSYTFYMVSDAAVAYSDITARLTLWNNYNLNASSPVFSNAAAFFVVHLGSLVTPGSPVFFTGYRDGPPSVPIFGRRQRRELGVLAELPRRLGHRTY